MDKAEYKVKLEEINSLAEAGDFRGAAAVMDTIEWKHIKSVRTLCMVGEIYEAVRRYDDSKRILTYAYNRSSASKSVLYRLTEINIRMGNYDEAELYFAEFEKVAPNDSSRYILKYKLLRARNASVAEQIEVLRAYKEHEYTERWAYELARLYKKNGQDKECVAECDDMILWFADGKYVMKAMELKMQIQPLTDSQQKKYNSQFKKAETTYAAQTGSFAGTGSQSRDALLENLTGSQRTSAADAISRLEAAADATVSGARRESTEPNVTPGVRSSFRNENSQAIQSQLASSIRAVFSGLRPQGTPAEDVPKSPLFDMSEEAAARTFATREELSDEVAIEEVDLASADIPALESDDMVEGTGTVITEPVREDASLVEAERVIAETELTEDMARAAAREMAEVQADIGSEVVRLAGEMKTEAEQTAAAENEAAAEAASELSAGVTAVAAAAEKAAAESAEEAAEAVEETVAATAEEAAEAAEEVAEAVEETVTATAEEAAEAAEAVEETAAATVEETVETAEETAAELVEEVAAVAGEKAEEAAEAAAGEAVTAAEQAEPEKAAEEESFDLEALFAETGSIFAKDVASGQFRKMDTVLDGEPETDISSEAEALAEEIAETEEAAAAVEEAAAPVEEAAEEAAEGAKETAEEAAEAVEETVEAAVEEEEAVAEEAVGTAEETAVEAVEAVEETAEETAEAAEAAVEEAAETAEETAEEAVVAVEETAEETAEAAEAAEAAVEEAAGTVEETVEEAVVAAEEAAEETAEAAEGSVETAVEEVEKAVAEAAGAAEEAAEEAAEAAEGSVEAAVEEVEKAVAEASGAAEEAAEETTEAAEGSVEAAVEEVEKAVAEAAGAAEEAAEETTEAAEGSVEAAVEEVAEAAEEAAEAVEETAAETTEVVEAVAEKSAEAVVEATEESAEAVETAVEEVTETAAAVSAEAESAAEDAEAAVEEAASKAITGETDESLGLTREFHFAREMVYGTEAAQEDAEAAEAETPETASEENMEEAETLEESTAAEEAETEAAPEEAVVLGGTKEFPLQEVREAREAAAAEIAEAAAGAETVGTAGAVAAEAVETAEAVATEAAETAEEASAKAAETVEAGAAKTEETAEATASKTEESAPAAKPEKPARLPYVPVEPRAFTETEAGLFSYLAGIPGIREQVTSAVADVHNNAGDKTSKSGNILVMGRSGNGKSRMTDGLILAICADLGIKTAKVAKINADEFNRKDVASAVKTMSGGFLVIERASRLATKTMATLSQAMEFRTDALTVILEDDKYELIDTLSRNPGFAEKFTSRVVIPVFTNDELVTFAKVYTEENGCHIDEMGTLALYTIIGENQKEGEPITVGFVKDLVDQAMTKAKKRRFRKAKDSQGRILIREKDFPY